MCPSCQEPIGAGDDATRRLPSDGAARPDTPERSITSSSHETLDGGRFLPGQVLASRYRIIDLIGRGGMGEVYRAEDLTLKQAVALKFLPENLTHDEPALERIRQEVRVARQIAHPYVCRVYDIGETDGQNFLCMEFIKGEELASVLKRFGRLPADKAVEISRQICAGLAAAHKQGVIHRDLKPANVMIDGEGNAKITDFGLAAVAEQLSAEEIRSGTPAYMSPEQLAGKPLTTRSDIYSLGLVLYEIFTGKPAFKADSLPAMLHLRNSGGTVASPASHVSGLDPLVERVIMRCLEMDVDKRPESAIAVAAALPGGDPLAAALAMGETPSPEMVAASGEKSGLRPWVAATLLGGIIAGLAIAAVFGNIANWKARALRSHSPQELALKARDMAVKLGYPDPPADSAFGFSPGEPSRAYLNYIKEHYAPGTNLWNSVVSGRPSPINFWYRQSPLYLHSTTTWNFGWVTPWDPPSIGASGMISIRLEPNGALRSFHAVPPERFVALSDDAPLPDWALLFTLAGLDPAAFTPTDPVWTLSVQSDVQSAWTGFYPGQPELPIRVNATSYNGKPVSFFIDNPWDPQPMAEIPGSQTADLVSFAVLAFLFLGLSLLAIWLARNNIRRGRGDRRGAARLAFLLFSLTLISWALGGDHNATTDVFNGLIYMALGQSLLAAGLAWLVYIALEPHIRKRWPETIVSWTRAVGGDVCNALVGRDVLIGVAVGVLSCLFVYSVNVIRFNTGSTPVGTYSLDGLLDIRKFIAAGIIVPIKVSVIIHLFLFLLVFLIRLVTRRRWLAGVVFVSLFTLMAGLGSTDQLMYLLPLYIITYTMSAVVILRFGLLPLVTSGCVLFLLGHAHISTDFSAWYSGYMIATFAMVLALAGFAFHQSLDGEKLFGDGLLNE